MQKLENLDVMYLRTKLYIIDLFNSGKLNVTNPFKSNKKKEIL